MKLFANYNNIIYRIIFYYIIPNAPLTKNQINAFPEIEYNGATVIGKGKGIFEHGMRISPTKVDIIRP